MAPLLADDAFNKGQRYLDEGNFESAIKNFRSAITHDKRNSRYRIGLAVALCSSGQPQEAIEELDTAIRDGLTVAPIYISRAFILNMQEQFQLALLDCDRAIKLDPKIALGWVECGVAKAQMGDAKSALADMNEGVRLDPHEEFFCC
jgi:tetratricopeptide (TPR) repeat protein